MSDSTIRLLLIEDSERDAARLGMELRRGGYQTEITRIETAARLREELARGSAFDLVICDYCLPAFSAPDALKIFRESGLDVPFIVVSGVVGEDIAVEMMRSGAQDYVLKENLARLVPAVARELREVSERGGRRRRSSRRSCIRRRIRARSSIATRGSWSTSARAS